MSKLRCIWLQNHQDEKTQAGDVFGSLRIFTLQPCDVVKCWCYYKSCDMTLLLAKIILRDQMGLWGVGYKMWISFFRGKAPGLGTLCIPCKHSMILAALYHAPLGLQGELPAVLARRQKRFVPLLPNMVTVVNTIFFWHYHQVSRYLTILFQDFFWTARYLAGVYAWVLLLQERSPLLDQGKIKPESSKTHDFCIFLIF